MKPPCLLALLSCWLLTGCNDSTTPPGSGTSVGSSLGQAQQRANKTIDLASLNKTIDRFYVQEGRFPTNLLELAAHDYIKMIPTLPEGMAWDYDTNTGTVSIIKEGVKD